MAEIFSFAGPLIVTLVAMLVVSNVAMSILSQAGPSSPTIVEAVHAISPSEEEELLYGSPQEWAQEAAALMEPTKGSAEQRRVSLLRAISEGRLERVLPTSEAYQEVQASLEDLLATKENKC